MSSGKPNDQPKNETFFKQKIISIPIVACGKTCPKYNKNDGVFLPRKIKKGKNLIIAVTPAITATIKSECVNPLGIFPTPFIVGKTKCSKSQHYNYHSGD